MPTASSSVRPARPAIPVPTALVDMNLPKLRDFTSRLRFDPNQGRIWLDERRIVMLHAEAYGSLRDELIASLGVDTARGLLTRIGYAAGSRDAELAWKITGPKATLEEVVRAGAILHALQGYVMPENLVPGGPGSLHGEDYYGEWIWKNSLEDETHIATHGVGRFPVCWTEVGYSSGYLSTCAGRRIIVREVECRAQGSAHCRNVAKPASRWDNPEEDLRFLEPQKMPPVRVIGGFREAPGAAPASMPEPAAVGAVVAAADDPIVGASAAFHVLRHKVLRVATTNATVLLLGESGVGKSMIARDIYRRSLRAARDFVEVNCAAIPETLVESELFGVERGAYSGASTSRPGRFEAADGGTLFLDEIGTLSMTAQGKLLRVLQNGELERLGSNRTVRTDVRVIAATNEDLKAAVQDGRFREDLFFRLNVFPIVIQPLRERREDIPLLIEVLLARFTRRHQRPVPGITHRAMQMILHHDWPGNIRELENVIERGVILAQDGEFLDVHDLTSLDGAFDHGHWMGIGGVGQLVDEQDEAAAASGAPAGAMGLAPLVQGLLERGPGALAEVEDALVQAALDKCSGNVSRAAAMLGLTRAQMDYRAKRLGG